MVARLLLINAFVFLLTANTVFAQANFSTQPDQARVLVGTPIILDVLANDFSFDGSPLQILTLDTQGNGYYHIVQVDNRQAIQYTPYYSQGTGRFAFQYIVSDQNFSDIVRESVIVEIYNGMPVVVDDFASGLVNTPIVVDLLSNDSDPDGHRLQIAGWYDMTGASPSIIMGPSPGSITVTPPRDFIGNLVIDYYVIDEYDALGRGRAIVTVTNNPPMTNNDLASTLMNTPVIIDVLANDVEIDGQPLSLAGCYNYGEGTFEVVWQNGRDHLRFTPAFNMVGNVTCRYWVTDQNGAYSQADVTVTVYNNIPVLNDDYVTTGEGVPFVIDVLANDYDQDGHTLELFSAGYASNGTVEIIVTDGRQQLFYTPNPGFEGTDSIRYYVTDGQAYANARATIVVQNNAPVAENDIFTFSKAGNFTLQLLANDFDPEGNLLQIVSVTQPAQGTVRINTPRTVIYTTAKPMRRGTYSFTYTVTDGKKTSTATVTINIQ